MKIIQRIAVRGTEPDGYTQEINLVQCEDANLYIDIRSWNSDHTKCKAGMCYLLTQLPELQRYIPELREFYEKFLKDKAVF